MRSSRYRFSFDQHAEVVQASEFLLPDARAIAARLIRCLARGHTIFWMGNGGSASQAQHLAAELVGRFSKQTRLPLGSVALTADTAVLTALANDFGYEQVFARQVRALCRHGDAVVGLTTSGLSPNVYKALAQARHQGAFTIAFTGAEPGLVGHHADYLLAVPSIKPARIQEIHLLLGHIICELIEEHQ